MVVYTEAAMPFDFTRDLHLIHGGVSPFPASVGSDRDELAKLFANGASGGQLPDAQQQQAIAADVSAALRGSS